MNAAKIFTCWIYNPAGEAAGSIPIDDIVMTMNNYIGSRRR